MKKDKTFFAQFHALYRLTTSSINFKNFITGVCRLYKQAFNAEKVVLICKNVSSYGFMKARLDNKNHYFKKGSKSIITRIEKEILNQGHEILFNNRLIYPLIFSNTQGAIYIKRTSKKEAFNELEKKQFLALSENLSTSLKVYNLYWEEQKAMLNYIKSLTGLLDQFVPTSYLHTKCTCRLIRLMSKDMKLSEAEAKSLEYASLLHDAGKIQVPSKLLSKQRPLTDEEYKLIQRHPKEGVELIKDLDRLKPVIPIILHHHERFDGKGYPSGLKKDEIPLTARILSVADAFDAMYFGRPYRKRRNLENIKLELKNQAGKQFDPKVIEVFLKMLKRKNVSSLLSKEK